MYDPNAMFQRIKALKKERGLSNEALAQQSGIPFGTLNKILGNQTKDPQISKIIMIAKALNVSTDYLVFGKESISDNFEKKTSAPTEARTDIYLRTIIDCYNSMNKTGQMRLAEDAEILRDSGRYDKHSNIQSEMNA